MARIPTHTTQGPFTISPDQTVYLVSTDEDGQGAGRLEPWQKKLDELQTEMEAAGLDFRALVPDQPTYESHDEGHQHG